MFDLEDEIARADSTQIENLLKAILDRYAVLFPDWEISAVPLPKSPQRDVQIDRMIAVLQGMKSAP